MGRFTIFSVEPTLEGDHCYHPTAIALVNCDDVYDDHIRMLSGKEGLRQLKDCQARQEFKHFLEINTIIL